MGRNLTGTTISSTYEGLVQISGSILTDGTGSNIDYLTVTASYAANVTTPTLQSVTDTGNTTTNVISSSAGVVLHEPSALNPTAYLQIGGLEDLTAVYFTAERNGAYQFRLASNDSTNSIVLNQSGSQTVKLDFSNSAGEIEANGDITLDTTFASSGGKVVSLAPVSSSYGFTGSLQGNADTATSASHAVIADSALTATSASHAVNADSAVSSSYAVTASFAENATSDFPYTGSAIISGSLNVTGSVSIDTQDDTANALYIKGGRVVIDSQNGTDSVWVNIGNNNSFTSTDKSPVFSLGAGINNQSAAHGTAFGENHTINSFGYNTFIAGGNGNTITGNKSAIIAGTSNVVNGHNNSVVVGGTSLQTTKDAEANILIP